MKIAIITPEFMPALGGVGVYTSNLVRELIKDESFEVHIITTKRKNTLKFERKNLHIHYISEAKDSFFYNLSFQYAVAKQVPSLHKTYRFDLIHSTGLVNMPDIFLNYDKLKIPHIVTVHTTIDTQFDYKTSFFDFLKLKEPVELYSKFAYPYIKLMQQNYIKRTKNFICVSDYVSKFLPKRKNTVVIPNGIDSSLFNPKKNDSFSLVDKISMPKVLFCGRLLYMKGIDVIIKAAKEILKVMEVHFVFAGAGNIRKWKKRFGDTDDKYFTFFGYLDNNSIAELYQKVDIFVLPSFIESFPLTILEAMSSGLPVIASRVGGIPEMIEDNQTGILIKKNDVIDLKNKLLHLLKNPKKAKEIGKRAREVVLKKYSLIRMVDATKKVYRDLT